LKARRHFIENVVVPGRQHPVDMIIGSPP
jgi:hypothetical protein